MLLKTLHPPGIVTRSASCGTRQPARSSAVLDQSSISPQSVLSRTRIDGIRREPMGGRNRQRSWSRPLSDRRPGGVMVSRPVSGVLSSASRRLGDHPSVRPTSGLPREGRTGRPYPTFGLAPGGVYRAARVAPGAGALLPHRFTLACAPVARGHRRSVLCGTVLRVAPTGCQPAPCPAEPRLSSTRSPRPRARRRTAVTRPTHHRRQCATGARAVIARLLRRDRIGQRPAQRRVPARGQSR
jgi:hypothetical protein